MPNPISSSVGGLKGSRFIDSVKDRSMWLGDREYQVLKFVFESGFVRFKLSMVWRELRVDRRRVHDAVKRLVAKGVLISEGKGWYRVVKDLTKVIASPVRRLSGRVKLLSQGQLHGTREPRFQCSSCSQCCSQSSFHSCSGFHSCSQSRSRFGFGGVVPLGLFFDNVRGFRFGGGWVGGDRGFVRGFRGLVGFESVSYAEVQFQVGGVVFPEGAQLVLYSNFGQGEGDRVRVELRPPRGFVREFGVAGGVRLFWELWLGAVKALLVLVSEAPLDVFRRFLFWFSGSGLGRFLLDSVRFG